MHNKERSTYDLYEKVLSSDFAAGDVSVDIAVVGVSFGDVGLGVGVVVVVVDGLRVLFDGAGFLVVVVVVVVL